MNIHQDRFKGITKEDKKGYCINQLFLYVNLGLLINTNIMKAPNLKEHTPVTNMLYIILFICFNKKWKCFITFYNTLQYNSTITGMRIDVPSPNPSENKQLIYTIYRAYSRSFVVVVDKLRMSTISNETPFLLLLSLFPVCWRSRTNWVEIIMKFDPNPSLLLKQDLFSEFYRSSRKNEIFIQHATTTIFFIHYL